MATVLILILLLIVASLAVSWWRTVSQLHRMALLVLLEAVVALLLLLEIVVLLPIREGAVEAPQRPLSYRRSCSCYSYSRSSNNSCRSEGNSSCVLNCRIAALRR